MSKSKLYILLFVCLNNWAFAQCNAEFDFIFYSQNKVLFNPKTDTLQCDWDFGDGIITNFERPIHFFNTSGVFNVCLIVFDKTNNCRDTFCKEVRIGIDSCKVDFNYVDKGYGTFLFNTINPKSSKLYNWKLDENLVSVDTNCFLYLGLDSTYTICLNAFDSLTGCFSKTCKAINIVSKPIIKEVKSSSDFRKIESFVFYDPNTKKYKIKLLEKFPYPVNIQLINSIGQILEFQENKSIDDIYLDTESLSRGIYFYSVDFKGFIMSTGKFLN